MSESAEIRAAGGVVVDNGRIAIVHRPKHGDWSLPKGKLDPGETWEQAALREVEEECGVCCELGDELPPTRYEVGGRPKHVGWWLMSMLEDRGVGPSGGGAGLRLVPPRGAAPPLRQPPCRG